MSIYLKINLSKTIPYEINARKPAIKSAQLDGQDGV